MTITFRQMTDEESRVYLKTPAEVRTECVLLHDKYPQDHTTVWAEWIPGLGLCVDGSDFGGQWGVEMIAEGSGDLEEVLEAWRKDCEEDFLPGWSV